MDQVKMQEYRKLIKKAMQAGNSFVREIESLPLSEQDIEFLESEGFTILPRKIVLIKAEQLVDKRVRKHPVMKMVKNEIGDQTQIVPAVIQWGGDNE